MATAPQPDTREDADVIPSSSSPEPRQGFLFRWRKTMVTAAGILLLAAAAVAGAAWFNYEPEYVRAARAEPEYTYEDLRRRTDGPDPDHVVPEEEWEKLMGEFKVRLSEVEAVQWEAMHTHRPSQQEVEDNLKSFLAASAGQAGSQVARMLKEFDLFDMLKDDGKKAKAQMDEVEAKQLKKHHEQHKHESDTQEEPIDPDELEDDEEQHKHKLKHHRDDEHDSKDDELDEDEEAKKDAADKLSEERSAQVKKAEDLKARFDRLQEEAKAKAKKAQAKFEALRKKREKIIEAKRKAEQKKLEAQLAKKRLGERKVMLEQAEQRAKEDEKQVLQKVSLYCTALMMPMGYEPGLLLAQKKKNVGIFQCDEWAVYSNQSEMMDGSAFPFPVHRVQGPQGQNVSLFVPLGGKWHTALNRDVFNQFWLEMLKVGRYRFHDWIIKVDPDSVFFPNRLKEVMGRRAPLNQIHSLANEPSQLDCRYCKKEGFETQTCAEHVHWMVSQGSTCRQAVELLGRPAPIDCGCTCNDFACDAPPSQAMYLNNCRFGLHGPIEVFSRRAIAMYIAGLPMCWKLFKHLWGEDKFIDKCMQKIGLTRVDVFDIMSEIACGEQPAPCGQFDTTFHPFKNVEKWFACWNFANKYGHGPEDRLAAIRVEQEDILKKLDDDNEDE